MNLFANEGQQMTRPGKIQEMEEKIKRAFIIQDKDLNGEIEKNELIDFLDGNCKTGKYDRNLAGKLFSILDLDDNGRITIGEFTKSYITLIDGIQNQIKELEFNYKQEDKNRARLELLVKNYINEILNDEELGPNSKFSIEIVNIDYIKGRLAHDGLMIRISFGNRVETTRILSVSKNELTWEQKFEFPVTRKHDIIFEIINLDPDDLSQNKIIGYVSFSLELIDKQEEYEVLLEVPELNNDKDVYAKINAKILFIWSLHKFYSDELVTSEERLKEIKNLISEKQNIIKNLEEPFSAYDNYEKKVTIEKKVNSNKIAIDPADSHQVNTNFGNSMSSNKVIILRENMYDKNNLLNTDILNKTTLTGLMTNMKERLNNSTKLWINIFSKVILFLLLIGLFSSIIRTDFIGIIIPLSIYIVHSTTFDRDPLNYIDRYKFAIGANLIFSGLSFNGSKNHNLFGIVYLLTIVSSLIKITLIGLLYIIKKQKKNETLLSHPTL